MSLTDIKTKSQGFTIVELLIVVVVIAILAAITIVSYNGITARANASASKSTAATVQKKAEAYNAENSTYPATADLLTAGKVLTGDAGDTSKSWYTPGVTIIFGSGTNAGLSAAPSNNSTVTVLKCGGSGSSQAGITQGNVTGLRIFYWNHVKSGGAGADSIDVGTTTNCPTGA